jgi:hypothetical protein
MQTKNIFQNILTIHFILKVRLSLRFQKVRFKYNDLKKVIFKNAVKRLAKSQFDI